MKQILRLGLRFPKMLRCDWLLNQTFIAQSEYQNHRFETDSDWTMLYT